MLHQDDVHVVDHHHIGLPPGKVILGLHPADDLSPASLAGRRDLRHRAIVHVHDFAVHVGVFAEPCAQCSRIRECEKNTFGFGVQPDLEVDLPVELPDLVAFLALDHAGRGVLQVLGQAALEHARRFDEVVVDADELEHW